MVIVCLDLEGVLTPEIWINVALQTNIPELKVTTRDISDYDELMRYRLKILREKKITFKTIQDIISGLKPLDGAVDFFNKLKERFQIIILSDTFYQFAMPLMKQLGYPTLLCHNLIISDDGFIKNYELRIKESKKNSIIKLKELNFKVIASGDSYNDILMLQEAHVGILFKPPQNIVKDFPQFQITEDYDALWKKIIDAENNLKK
jgi:phosphoserine / homoserine phosphotransferase